MHSERAPQLIWIQLLLIGISIVVAVMAAYSITMQEPGWPVLTVVLVLILWAFVSFFTISYEVDDEEVRAQMWPFSYRIPRDEIEHVEIKRIPWWAGFGYHILGKRRFINTIYGPCLVIRRTNGASLWITPQDPDAFAKLLDKRRR